MPIIVHTEEERKKAQEEADKIKPYIYDHTFPEDGLDVVEEIPEELRKYIYKD